MKPQIALASSTAKSVKFDNKFALKEAFGNEFTAYQLFLDDRFLDNYYLSKVIEIIETAGIETLVIHLPNLNENLTIDHAYIETTNSICAALATKCQVQVLIHYRDEMSACRDMEEGEANERYIPVVAGKRVGLENSITGSGYTIEEQSKHIVQSLALARLAQSFFVFDPGRMMYASDIDDLLARQNFIVNIIRSLIPGRDIIHIAGKTSWTLRFAESACATNDPGDIGAFYMTALAEFIRKGGVVVIEHEDLEMSLDSRANMLKLIEEA